MHPGVGQNLLIKKCIALEAVQITPVPGGRIKLVLTFHFAQWAQFTCLMLFARLLVFRIKHGFLGSIRLYPSY